MGRWKAAFNICEMKQMKNYKGSLIEDGAMGVLGLVFIGMFTGAGIVALAQFSTGYQSTLSSNSSLWTFSQQGAVNALGNGTQSILNFSIQLPTIGTIVAIGLMITVLVGALLGAYAFFAKR